jgi:hypothetical protein
LRAVVSEGLKIPPGLVVPDKAKVRTAHDLSRYADAAQRPRPGFSINDVSPFDSSQVEGLASGGLWCI